MKSVMLPDMPQEWRNTGERLFYLRLMDVLNSVNQEIVSVSEGGNKGDDAASEEPKIVWETFATESFVNWGDADPFGATMIDGIVFLRGAGKLASALANNGVLTIATLAEKYRPEYRVVVPIMSDAGALRLTVNTNGNVQFRNTTGASLANSTYISLACSYVTGLYAGTDEPEPGAQTYLYDKGTVEGYSFVSNGFPRPNYTGVAKGILEANTMRINLPGVTGSTSIPFNAHVCTSAAVTIPTGATKLKVLAKKTSATNTLLNFGLLPSGASNSYSTSSGGQLSGDRALTTTETVYEITLTDAVKSATNLKCIVNAKANMKNGTAAANAVIYQIWFE